MKIQTIRITIAPEEIISAQGLQYFRMQIVSNNIQRTVQHIFHPNDFQSCFDYLLERSREEILKILKKTE